MKRIVTSLAALALIGAGLTGCGSSPEPGADPSETIPAAPATSTAADTPSEPATPVGDAALAEQDGTLVDTDPQAGVVEGAGFEITVDPVAKTALFQTIDPESGEAYQNSALFDYTNGTFVRTVFVAAMGATFVYTSDLASDELQSIQNGEGEDVSDSVKEQSRWDNAVEGSATQRADIESDFEARYGMTVEKAATA